MKSLVLSLLLVGAVQAGAATVELGKYKAKGNQPDVEGITASILLKANKDITFNINSPDVGLVTCSGQYEVSANLLVTDVECDSMFVSSAHVEINITNVTPESVRSVKGAEVLVLIDALSDVPAKFLLKKAD
jgi:hypothetical protein